MYLNRLLRFIKESGDVSITEESTGVPRWFLRLLANIGILAINEFSEGEEYRLAMSVKDLERAYWELTR
ncbi:hypothetical protein [Vulcanisaeta sp. JCM 16159]|uniref:hypothetical protein n=1 Tax=Vulcanisaeta sp. JCM 16159 TaxID=1295371 RepID=UPI0006D00DE8|nr:hypothetical protein [Vulcanisaeta sp. JCM 16159]